jgi:hypothetical protein
LCCYLQQPKLESSINYRGGNRASSSTAPVAYLLHIPYTSEENTRYIYITKYPPNHARPQPRRRGRKHTTVRPIGDTVIVNFTIDRIHPTLLDLSPFQIFTTLLLVQTIPYTHTSTALHLTTSITINITITINIIVRTIENTRLLHGQGDNLAAYSTLPGGGPLALSFPHKTPLPLPDQESLIDTHLGALVFPPSSSAYSICPYTHHHQQRTEPSSRSSHIHHTTELSSTPLTSYLRLHRVPS